MVGELVPFVTIEGLVRYRNKALESFTEAQQAVARCNELAERAAPRTGGNQVEVEFRFSGLGRYAPVRSLEEFRQALDRACWESLMERIGIRAVMGKRQRDAMRNSLKQDAPAFELDNVRATLETFVAGSGNVLRQSIVDIFDDLAPGFVNHDSFKIPVKVIHRDTVRWCHVSRTWSWWCGPGRDALIDLERIMRRFDGKELAYTAADAVDAAMQQGLTETITGYFHLKWHKSGTLHIEMLRRDLVDAMNREIAMHFGAAIPMGTGKADPRRNRRPRCSI